MWRKRPWTFTIGARHVCLSEQKGKQHHTCCILDRRHAGQHRLGNRRDCSRSQERSCAPTHLGFSKSVNTISSFSASILLSLQPMANVHELLLPNLPRCARLYGQRWVGDNTRDLEALAERSSRATADVLSCTPTQTAPSPSSCYVLASRDAHDKKAPPSPRHCCLPGYPRTPHQAPTRVTAGGPSALGPAECTHRIAQNKRGDKWRVPASPAAARPKMTVIERLFWT